MTHLTHVAAAEVLFATGQTPVDAQAAVAAIAREYGLHPSVTDAALAMAQSFGDYPDTAPARMRRCLDVAPDQIELPDAVGVQNGGKQHV